MSFAGSAHERSWLFSLDEIAACRSLANRHFRARATGRSGSGGLGSNANAIYTTPNGTGENSEDDATVKLEVASQSALSEQEEEELVLRHFCRQMQICLSPEESRSLGFASRDHKYWRVRATAIVFFRRFFLNNALYAHDPRVIMLGCVVLASKVEESRIERVQDLILQLNPKATEESVLGAELRVVQAVNFHTKVFHPQNLCQTIIADLKRKFSSKTLTLKHQGQKHITVDGLTVEPIQPHVFDAWLPAAEEILSALQLTNACLAFSPLQIAFAALSLTEALAKGSLLEKVEVKKDIISITLKTEADKDADATEGSVLLKYFGVEFGVDWTIHKGQEMLSSIASLIRGGQNCREHQEVEKVRKVLASIRNAADWSLYQSGTATHADSKRDIKPVGSGSTTVVSNEPERKRVKREV